MSVQTPDRESPGLTIYTKPGCVACEMTRRQLSRAGVAYEVVDLSERPDLVDMLRRQGLVSAPVVETADGERTSGFRPDRIRAIVSAATSRPASRHPAQAAVRRPEPEGTSASRKGLVP